MRQELQMGLKRFGGLTIGTQVDKNKKQSI